MAGGVGGVICLGALAVLLLPAMTGCAPVPGGDGEPRDVAASTESVPEGWPTYSDAEFGFSFRHPGGASVETLSAESPARLPPGVAKQVRVRDQGSATSDTADLQPPLFTVDVFRNSGHRSLEEWLDAAMEDGATRAPERVGDADGYRVRLDRYIVPGEFVYLAGKADVYRLTPIGDVGGQVLASFVVGD